MKTLNMMLPKLCFAQPGEIVRLTDDDGNVLPDTFIVCVVNTGARPMPKGASNGLYSEDRPTFLVSTETGVARAMPHLSSRVRILRDAVLVTGEEQ